MDVDWFSRVAIRKGALTIWVGWLASWNSKREEFVFETRLLYSVSVVFSLVFRLSNAPPQWS